jgi:nucleotide-binding universal stress UspA family protein
MARIVVGTDGSEGARAALRFAVEEARLRSAKLEAVYAWHYPALALTAPVPATYDDELEESAKELLQTALDGIDTSGVEVDRELVRGPAASALTELAKGADLLVVGSRGHGGFKGLLLGSVSQQCAHHAPCPVVIVRPMEHAPNG